jgi:hypothetical protein
LTGDLFPQPGSELVELYGGAVWIADTTFLSPSSIASEVAAVLAGEGGSGMDQ